MRRSQARALLAASLASLLAGCPGYRRPPPETLAAREAQARADAEAESPPQPPPPKPPPRERLTSLKAELASLRQAAQALGKSPPEAPWRALLARLTRAEQGCDALETELRPQGRDEEEGAEEDPLLLALDELQQEFDFLRQELVMLRQEK